MASNVQINPAQSALQNLLNLVDSQNPYAPANPSQITTSNLSTLTAGSVSSDPTANTSVEIDAATGQSRYQGSVVVYYAREALADQIAAVTGSVTVTSADSADALLAKVAAFYRFIPSEITWDTVPTYPGTAGTANATIKSTDSLVYADGTATVSLNWVAAKTAMLLHFDGADEATSTVDSSGYANVMTMAAGAQLTTTETKFGTSAVTVANTTGITTPDATWLRATGDFTIEGWFYITDGGSNQALFGKAISGGAPYAHLAINQGSWYFYTDSNSQVIQVPIPDGSTDVWNHIAMVRSGTVWTFYQNGVSIGSVDNGDTFGDNAGPFIVGGWGGGTASFLGIIDEFRVSNVARYTANFTPPTSAFTLD